MERNAAGIMTGQKRFSNISYLRVLACLGVVCTHMGQKLGVTGKVYELTHYMRHGVYLFFIISGFLALYTYRSKGYTVWRYWGGRLARILPVYYAIIIYDFILFQLILGSAPADEYHLGWLRYVFLISYSVPGDDFWRNMSFTWTVSVFVLFYLLVPLLDRLVKSYRASWVALLVTYVLMNGVQWLYGHYGIDTAWFAPVDSIIYFMFGVVVCRAVQYGRERNAIVAFGALMLYYMAMSRFTSLYTLSCLLCMIVLGSMGLEFKNRYVQGAFAILDRYSYEIYLGHAVVMEGIDLIRGQLALTNAAVFAIGITGTVLVSLFLYHAVDRPVGRLLAKNRN